MPNVDPFGNIIDDDMPLKKEKSNESIIDQIQNILIYDDLDDENKLNLIKGIIQDVTEKPKKNEVIVVLDHSYTLGFVYPVRKPYSEEDVENLYENILREHGRKPSECSWMIVDPNDFAINNHSDYEIEINEH